VVVGAGMAGVAAAHELAVGRGMRDVVLIDERAPLTLTSDKSSECYRNWWPGPDATMLRYMTRSIDLLEEMVALPGMTSKLIMDAHLAAFAIGHGLTLCSSDRDFARFPKLRWFNPLAV